MEARFPDNLPTGWREILKGEKSLPYFTALSAFLKKEAVQGHPIYPPFPLTLRALREVDYADVRVVILGQDPYHGPGQAIGLSFAVPNDFFPKPPSLQNIFKEIRSDLKVELPLEHSDLSGWVDQGVLLLNSVLSVRAGQAFSHRDKGWETFTDRIIRALGERPEPMVFLLWGAAAAKKKSLIGEQHLCLLAPHPSPLSAHRGFLGCRHFSKTNAHLKRLGLPPIDWSHSTR